ncbi:GxxExxY protein [Haloferula sargassicola]|uniref:GxxExxY protein n=1 Tax=Haloferula sargassicola TaxID=490096 RepID=A0ABP9ULM8_9BACT
MDANGRELVLKDEAHAIVGGAMEVHNGLGFGLNEKPYENALVVEFTHRGIPFVQQPRFPVLWRNVKVGEFIPDLIAFERIVVDTKTIEQITDHERGQMLNYLRITQFPLGLIINFKHRRLQWERIVLTLTR